jgi:hypothetical protein
LLSLRCRLAPPSATPAPPNRSAVLQLGEHRSSEYPSLHKRVPFDGLPLEITCAYLWIFSVEGSSILGNSHFEECSWHYGELFKWLLAAFDRGLGGRANLAKDRETPSRHQTRKDDGKPLQQCKTWGGHWWKKTKHDMPIFQALLGGWFQDRTCRACPLLSDSTPFSQMYVPCMSSFLSGHVRHVHVKRSGDVRHVPVLKTPPGRTRKMDMSCLFCFHQGSPPVLLRSMIVRAGPVRSWEQLSRGAAGRFETF